MAISHQHGRLVMDATIGFTSLVEDGVEKNRMPSRENLLEKFDRRGVSIAKGAATLHVKMGGCDDARTRGNEAWKRGDHLEAERWYTEALEGSHTAEERAKCLSNRATVRMARGAGEEAWMDAKKAVEETPMWSKAHVRLGETLRALHRHSEAAECFAKALALQPDDRARERALQSLALLARGVKCQTQRKVMPGMQFRPGELVADAEPGAVGSLVKIFSTSKDRATKLASIIQLSVLAAAPDQKTEFFDGVCAVVPLITYAQVQDLDRDCCPRGGLPLALAEMYNRNVGTSYEASHPLTAAAFGFSRLVANKSACSSDLNLGLMMLRSAGIMRALSKLVTDTQGFDEAQSFLCECFRGVMDVVTKGGAQELSLALEFGVKESLEVLHRDAVQNDRASSATYLQRLLRQIIRHPDHPDNQVPAPS